MEKSHTHFIYSEYQAKSLILNKQIYKWLFSAKLTGGWAGTSQAQDRKHHKKSKWTQTRENEVTGSFLPFEKKIPHSKEAYKVLHGVRFTLIWGGLAKHLHASEADIFRISLGIDGIKE